jgi:hypothetical protein
MPEKLVDKKCRLDKIKAAKKRWMKRKLKGIYHRSLC